MAIGIDFGTSNSVVAACESEQMPVRVIELDDVDAAWRGIGLERVFPSLVAAERDGFLYGWAAKFSDGDRVDAVKRMLESDEDLVLGELRASPTTVAASILAEIRQRSRDNGFAVHEAVLSIPSNATGRQRYRTMLAAERAGIRPLRLINEPTAAALAFMAKIPPNQRDGSYLVFDWGGGTLDVTVLEHAEGVSQEVISHGVKKLGGLDFDERFHQLVSSKLRTSSAFDPIVRQSLERKKIALSVDDQVHVSAGGRNVAIHRSEFETVCEDLVQSAMEAVDAALQQYGQSVDWPVLVGGTSQIPAVRRAIRRRLTSYHADLGLPGDEQEVGLVSVRDFNPLTAIAEGAAIAACIATDSFGDEQLHLTMANDMGTIAHHADGTEWFSRIIQRGTPIPYRASEPYTLWNRDTSHGGVMNVSIVEGDGSKPLGDPSFVELQKVPVQVPRRLMVKANRKFHIEYAYDENALMHVRVVWLEPNEILFDEKVGLADPDARTQAPAELMRALSRAPSPIVEGSELAVLPHVGANSELDPIVETPLESLLNESADQASNTTSATGPFVVVDGSNIACEVSLVSAGRKMSYRRLLRAVDQFLGELDLPRDGLVLVVDANFRHNVMREEKRAVEEDHARGTLLKPPAQARGKADSLILKVAERKAAQGRTIVLTNDAYTEFRGDYPKVFRRAEFWGATLVQDEVVFLRREVGRKD